MEIKQKLNENRSFQMNFRTMLDAQNQQEFFQIMQKEVDVINTDNTVIDQQNDRNGNPINSFRDELENSNILKYRKDKKVKTKIREMDLYEKKEQQYFYLNKDMQEKMENCENKCRVLEKRIIVVEESQKNKPQFKELEKRIKKMEEMIFELKNENKGKSIKKEKELTVNLPDKKNENNLIEPKKNEILNEAIKNLRSKLEYRNSLIKNFSKTQKVN